MSSPDAFLDSTTPLAPGDAAGALILVDNDRYLLQQRDDLDFIFFPGHWGCFGGAVEPGETVTAALCRELQEEIGLEVVESDLRYFFEMAFELSSMNHGWIRRPYYEIRIDEACYRGLSLHEGQRMDLFTGREALALSPITPYDRFALWLHVQQDRFRQDR